MAVPCQESKECGPNYTCTEGICLLGCADDSSCAVNERCLNGKCLCKLNENVMIMIITNISLKTP